MNQNKAIIFDASTLISFAMNGMFDELRKLKEVFGGKFIITSEVNEEIVEKPINIKRFELEALRIKKLIEDKVIETPSSLGIKDKDISYKTRELLEIANQTFDANGKKMHIVDLGEVSALVLSKILTEKGINNVIAVDERTTRMLIEKPDNLERLFEKKLHTKIRANKNNFKFFKGPKLIRSTELAYVAYKKGLVNLKNPETLDALLYAMKYKGCSISEDEIEEMKRIK
ncbi:hypothetical protein HY212_06105 [Candidatus Pacearchaeota archaeon]|nr:hypothetical protein [Candidatus Pacearchaeota archaeon]